MSWMQRFSVNESAPGAERAIGALDEYVASMRLDSRLLELVRVRASQLNGCAYCIDMHTKDARARGETEERLYALAAWRESPIFSARERAALAWTEAVTLVAQGGISDDVYEQVSRLFSESEVAGLLLAVIAVNAWNRVAISQRLRAGDYVSPLVLLPA